MQVPRAPLPPHLIIGVVVLAVIVLVVLLHWPS